MAFIEDLFYNIMSKIPGRDTATGVAQDRYTHTPVVFGNFPDMTAKMELGGYSPTRRWGPLAFQSGVPLSGIPADTAGTIKANTGMPGYTPSTLRHEIIHAATVPDLDPNGSLYKTVNQLLPKEVKANTDALYSYNKISNYDVVHESVPKFLTDDDYADKKYNAAKLKLVNAFPTATRNKLIRIMAMQGGPSAAESR